VRNAVGCAMQKLKFIRDFVAIAALIYAVYGAGYCWNMFIESAKESGRQYELHSWSEWSEPEMTNNWSSGTWYHQWRKCSHCGKIETKHHR